MDVEQVIERLARGVTLAGEDAGIRIQAILEPAAGPGVKVFPPTYPFGTESPYVIEERYEAGESRSTVLLDSYQSQANRCEQALLDAADDRSISLPFLDLRADIDGVPVRVTSLQAPHRGPDAYFRDSEDTTGTAFDDCDVGQRLRHADARSARAFFELVPTDLVYGFWDSHRGGRGVKLARSYTSEVVGLDPQKGMRGAIRFDPYNIEKVEIAFPKKQPGEFVVVGDAGVPKGQQKGKPSEVGHGNAISTDGPAGVAIALARRSAFLSFAGLARLRFPDSAGAPDGEADKAARVALAALALLGDRLAFGGPALLLRSGCELVPLSEEIAWLGRGATTEAFTIDTSTAIDLWATARARAEQRGFVFSEPVPLRPKANLRDLLAHTFALPPDESE